MKHLVIFLSAAMLTTSCAKTCQDSDIPQTQASNSPKTIFSLPDEDMVLLKTHNPHILKKLTETTPISIDDIISLQQLGFTSDVLIRIINYTGSRFQLSTADVLKLQAEGVPFKVINYMIRT